MMILRVENMTLTLPSADHPILQQLNFEMRQGDFMILLGSNGSGKSSLLNTLHRYYPISSGQIYFQEKSIHDYSEKKLSEDISILTQDCADSLFTSLTLYENYLLAKQHDSLHIPHAKERSYLMTYLTDFNPNLANKLDATIDQLSGGEKQALALALCFLQPPRLLLLDEHTSALDPKTSDQIMQLTQKMIVRHHITCILTTHDLDIALHYGNRILVLREGKIDQIFDKEKYPDLKKEMLIASCY